MFKPIKKLAKLVLPKGRKGPPPDYRKVVKPGEPIWKFHWGEVWRYRYMLMYLIRRDLVILYKQTVLGPAWLVLQPLFMTLVINIAFSRIAGIRTDGIPSFLFHFSNQLLWTYVSSSFIQLSTVFAANKYLMGRVYFPRLVIPLATMGSVTIKFGIQVILLVAIYGYYWLRVGGFDLGWQVLLYPITVIQMAMISMGIGLLFAAANLKYRDLGVIAGFFVQAWMYLSPVAYPVSEVVGPYRWLMIFNPASSALELGRYCLFGVGTLTPTMLIIGWSMSIVLFVAGLLCFNKVQRKFIDIV